ncbi:pyridoxal-phosphate dependent enzyme [Streptomyces violaceusniger]|uniref:pyridoxal-phosphate dependent enzyme n=1 Tax=Streptomyces violaceusniger TaxID=68280 RepID=UPI00131C8B64|nr:pyridoxal-phosphate dependent enzyme [Streptomyces hygroscopicus]
MIADKGSRPFSRPPVDDRSSGLWRWRDSLPRLADGAEVTLGEGNTPLLDFERQGYTLHIKDESQNPTWSHKDRLCAVAASHAVSTGAQVMVVSSSGNHALSAAAYAARAGLPCVVITHEGMPPAVRSAVEAFGALLVIVPGPDRWPLVERSVHELGWYPFSNYTAPVAGNPVAADGYKTIAFELAEQLSWTSPTSIIVPTGYAEALCGIWRGFKDMRAAGAVRELPKMVSVEPAVSAPLHTSLLKGLDRPVPVEAGKSIAASINVKVTSLDAMRTIRESGGAALAVGEEEIAAAHGELAFRGLYVENASAASFAGLLQAEADRLDLGERPVVLTTSSGLKDAHTRRSANELTLDGTWDSFLRAVPEELLSP